jgi:cytochrome c-type biogenesis protein CcmH/NrfF
MSPFCPGRTISDCPSQQAKNMKMWMVVQEAAGRTREDVQQELIERYGEVLRPAPRAEGFGVAAYAFPVVAFLAGGAFIALYLRRQTRAPESTPAVATPAALDPEFEKMIDDELGQ